MFRIIILPKAKADIKDAAEWYNTQKQGLGKRFTNEVRSKVQYAAKNPHAVSIRYDETRCVVFETFPYMAHFVIDEDNRTILIVAVYHTSLNPNQWKNR